MPLRGCGGSRSDVDEGRKSGYKTGERKRMGKRRVASAERHRIRQSNRCHALAGNIYCARDPLKRVRRTTVYYYHQIVEGDEGRYAQGRPSTFESPPGDVCPLIYYLHVPRKRIKTGIFVRRRNI